MAAAALPFLLLGYGGAAFAGYAICCEAVDAGIGDGWRVPVGNDHYFCMIDVPEEGYLLKGGCSGAPIVRGINKLGAAGDLLVGNSESSGPFVLNTRTAELQTFVSVDAALAGIKPQPILRSAGEFYDDRRWGRADVVAAVLIGGPAIATAIVWYSCFIRRSPARDDAAAATPS